MRFLRFFVPAEAFILTSTVSCARVCGIYYGRLFAKNLFFFSLFSDISHIRHICTTCMLERARRGATLCPCACRNAAYALPALYRKPNPVSPIPTQ